METTFENRANTNTMVYARVNEKIEEQGGKKRIIKFSEAYQKAKTRRLKRIIRAEESEPAKAVTFRTSLEPWSYPNKRVGAPKAKWAMGALREYFKEVAKDIGSEGQTQEYNPQDEQQEQMILEHACKDTITEAATSTTATILQSTAITPEASSSTACPQMFVAGGALITGAS